MVFPQNLDLRLVIPFFLIFFFLMIRRPPRSTLFPYTTSSDLSPRTRVARRPGRTDRLPLGRVDSRSEEHTSELQSRQYLVCRLLLENKKKFAWSLRLNNKAEVLIGATPAANSPHVEERQRALMRAARMIFFFLRQRRPPRSTLFPYTTLFR